MLVGVVEGLSLTVGVPDLDVYVREMISSPPLFSLPGGSSPTGLWEGGGGHAFETRLLSVFVNPSLIISTEVENKSPGNDAEPEITPGF